MMVSVVLLLRLFLVLTWTTTQLAWTLSQFSTSRNNNNHNDHLTDRVSSPERYASAMNMTLLELEERKEEHRQALAVLQEQLQNVDDGVQKHELICNHRFQHLHHPFVCRHCWSYLPVCVCDHKAVIQDEKESQILHPQHNLSVVVWLHHKEWGLTSNTGGLLRLALGPDNCKLFMKGLPEHDAQFQRDYLDDQKKLVVVLWPENENGKKPEEYNDEKSKTLSVDDLRKELDDGREVVVVAVDGTWRNARRMVGRLPSHIPRLDIPSSVVQRLFSDDQQTSLLSPIRSKGPSGPQSNQNQRNDNNLVCTAEAVTMILQELGLPSNYAQNMLDLARTKVDLVRRYRGHEPKNIQ